MPNNISITGLGSGLDTASIVSSLVAVQGAPINRLNAKVTVVTAQKSTLATLASQMATLASKADAMKTATNLRSNTATSSDSTSVSVAVSGTARPGTFDVAVSKLAMPHRSYSDTVSARDQGGLFGTGSISVKVGGADAVNVDVTASMTLDDVAAQIDNISGLDASVVYDGSTFRLQITGQATGAANAVTLSETGTTLGLASGANLRQVAQDSEFTVDGIAMKRGSNLVDDAFAGVSLSLNKVTTSATIGITADSSGITTKMTDMVNAYNAVIRSINSQASVVGADNSRKLTGDSTLATLQRSLSAMMSTTLGSGTFKSFAELGVSTQRDGTITLDSGALSKALSANRDGVASVIASNPATAFVGLSEQLGKIAHAYGDSSGILPARVTAMDARIRTMNNTVSDMQTRLDAYETQLNTKFAAMETLVNQWKSTASSVTQFTNSKSST